MRYVLFVFRAERFQQIGVRKQALLQLDSEWPGISLRIVNGQPHLHMAEVQAMKSLGQVQRLAMRVATRVQPSPVIEADRSTTSVSPSHLPTEYPSQDG